MFQSALYKAIHYFGSQEALAKAIGVKQQSISNWLNREHSIPFKQVLKIVAATNGYVSHHELAPQEKQLNKIIDNLIKASFTRVIKIPIEKIKENHQLCLHHDEDLSSPQNEINQEILRRPILVDQNFQLMECNCRLRLHKKLGHNSIFAKIVHE